MLFIEFLQCSDSNCLYVRCLLILFYYTDSNCLCLYCLLNFYSTLTVTVYIYVVYSIFTLH